MDEAPADQELLEDAIKLEPIHLPVFKSSRLLEAAQWRRVDTTGPIASDYDGP